MPRSYRARVSPILVARLYTGRNGVARGELYEDTPTVDEIRQGGGHITPVLFLSHLLKGVLDGPSELGIDDGADD